MTSSLADTVPTAAQPVTWRRAQAASGVMIGAFVALHLVNLPFALVPGGYDAAQRLLRAIYQSPAFEIPLVAALAVHIAAGIRNIATRGRAPAATWPQRLHRLSAWYLLAVVGLHVAATRGASLFFGVYPESAGVAFALAWLPLFFWPYYLLLALSGLVHLGYGAPRAIATLRRASDRSAGSRSLALSLVIGAVLVVLGVIGLSGAFYEIPDPFGSDYAALYLGDEDFARMPAATPLTEAR